MKRAFEFLCILLIGGCSNFNHLAPAPVVSLTDYKEVTQGVHVVNAGETLYEIAWKYGRDYRDLAAVNHLKAPYTIYPNQHLNLRKRTAQDQQHLEIAHSVESKPRSKPDSALKMKIANSNETWMWPVQGPILKRYSQAGGFKGIDIGGVLRAPIVAAKSGKVVYSGHGLRGYGNLLIIKHNESYLSAYAHNDKLLVHEGETVQKNQLIAYMGKTEAESVRLHFEIRKDGKPLNPENILPKIS